MNSTLVVYWVIVLQCSDSWGASEHYARMGVGKPAGFIQIDAMDHAKCAMPRWTDASQEWPDHWRPHLQ